MLSPRRRQWGTEQWVACLKERDIPVLQRSKDFVRGLEETGQGATIAPRELVGIVFADPYLALRLLRQAEAKRSRTLGHETTTPLATILQIGFDGLRNTLRESASCDDSNPGLAQCCNRAFLAAHIARAWAMHRADISPDEVTLAALLSEVGELMLWAFAPEVAQAALDELRSGRALRTVQAQQQTAGFSFKLLTLAFAEAWQLPPLIIQLIKGSDNVRANIARLATDTARHIETNPENPAIPSDLVSIREYLPQVAYRDLIAPLPLPETYRDAVLLAVDKEAQ